MSTPKHLIWIALSFLILAALACTLGVRRPTAVIPGAPPSATPTVAPAPTATQGQAAPPAPAATATAAPLAASATPQNPLVTDTAYCWSGPAASKLKYEVISSIQAGTRVQLLGRGAVDGWLVVRNPRYNDPCWIEQQYLQIDPAYDLTALKVFAVPPTPTATP